jgi:hypothetical protein
MAVLASSVRAVRAQEDGHESVPVPPAIATRGVPAVAAAAVEGLLAYENLRSASLLDWHPGERRVLIGTRFGETRQVHEVARPLGTRSQVTFFEDPIQDALYRPGRAEQIAYSRDRGGDENFQVYLLDRGTGRSRRLSDGIHRYGDLTWSPDGRLLAYTSNARNGRDSDLYLHDVDGPAAEGTGAGAGSARRLAELSGSWSIADWSADGRSLLLVKYVSVAESVLFTADAASGRLERLTPAAEPPAAYFGGRFLPDGASILTVTDRGSEFRRLMRLDLATGAWTALAAGIDWGVEGLDLSDDGSLVAFFTNEDGVSRLHLQDAASGRERPAPELPAGVAGNLRFRPGSREVAFTLSWARSPMDVYSYDADSGLLEPSWCASGPSTACPVRRPPSRGRPAPSRPFSTCPTPRATPAAGPSTSPSTAAPRGSPGRASSAATTSCSRSWV